MDSSRGKNDPMAAKQLLTLMKSECKCTLRWIISKGRRDTTIPLGNVRTHNFRKEFEQLSEAKQLPYAQGAEELREIAAAFDNAIGRILRETNGRISWGMLAKKLAGSGPVV